MKKLASIIILALAAAVPGHSADVALDNSVLQADMEAQVADDSGGWMAGDYLTGNWGGLRKSLEDSGVGIFGFYNNIYSGNVSGGKDPGHGTYVLDAWLGVKLDLEKLVGWKGGEFVVSGIERNGKDLTSEYIGSVYTVQQMVGGQTYFLYQVFLLQKFLDDRFALKVGRFGASDDFNTSPFYGYSLNNGINGDIRNVLFDTQFSAYPFATWAGAMFFNPTPETFVKFGVFQVADDMFDPDDHGVDWSIEGDDGVTMIAEIGWTPELFKRPVPSPETSYSKDGKAVAAPPVMKGMPGHYWIGATYSTWGGYQKFDGGRTNKSYGFYANADQMVYQEAPGSDQGLTAILASGYYPQEKISIVPFQLNCSLNYKGLIPGRDDDRTMLHYIYGRFSRSYAGSVRAAGGGNPRNEQVVEFAHRLQLTKWAYFQPDVQYVIYPGGTGNIDNALVIGFQAGVTF